MILQDAFTVEPWNLHETHLDLDLLAQTESVFALANGHVGWRANLDEGEPHARGPAVADSVVEGQRQLGHLAGGQLPADSPGPVDDPAQAEDRYLRVADPGGMAPDDRDGLTYVADSLLSVIWPVSIADGTVSAWARPATGSRRRPRRQRAEAARRRGAGQQHPARDATARPPLA